MHLYLLVAMIHSPILVAWLWLMLSHLLSWMIEMHNILLDTLEARIRNLVQLLFGWV
jgi:hypothetical protein